MPELRPIYPLADARNAIIEAAITVFSVRGFHGATMRDIAEQAGVSQGLLHHHFGNKDGLWNIVGERISADFLEYVAQEIAPDASPEESVGRAARRYMAYWKEHPAAFRFNLWRLLEGRTEERSKRSKSLNERSVPLIQRAQAAGLIRDDMPAGLVLIILGALVQFWLHSQIEITDALAVTGDVPPSDDAFIEILLGLVGAQDGKAKRKPKK
ncbi:TetR/AcrR family transcriptional regulator [Dongia sedimenti]|uniref:TetR family transcriptional regulator n=1 Tax=Dongia sedimenti TaxID=3064282 RepID=A0ABU0YRT7_9PROT|nr:TetR family transcriptional regulator [Rhodospirillaceae bacterium R-7]